MIQSRFQGKPYFDYGKIPPKNEESATFAPGPNTVAPVRQAAPPTNSFPAVFNVAPVTSKPPVDLYTSPYTSYNPPPQQQPNAPSDSYASPPKDSYAAPPSDSYAVPPSSNLNGPYDYKPRPQMVAPTFEPPLAPSDVKNVGSSDDMPQKMVDAPPSEHSAKYHDDGPPDYPPKSEDDIYYPPDVPHDDVSDNGMMNQPPAEMMDHPKHMGDVSAPNDDHGAHFPQYLYNDPHFDHHVYEEIPHTTPAPVKEDKRVSTTNYSYYYLGRKLWYIPLYFSIYFMIYVTVLILKAIARHKIELKHDWATSHSRSGREMSLDREEEINSIHRNVTQANERVTRSYANIAMK